VEGRTSAGHKGEAMILSHRIPLVAAGLAYLLVGPAACGSGAKSEGELKSDIVSMMHTLMLGELQDLNQAAIDLQAAAPATFALGWDPAKDSGAQIDTMKEAWSRTRLHWERAEGPIAPMFSDLDVAIDSRYEDMIQALPAGDPDPFDGQGMIGMHAIERILYAPGPMAVADHEQTVAGANYAAAAWPTSDAQAAEFKNGLCQRLVTDTQMLLTQWKTKSIDLAAVFTGLTGLISLQSEKVGLAAMNQQESRYSQTTMTDLRSNLAGTRAVYDLFELWLATKAYGTMLDMNAKAAFDRLDGQYMNVSGDAIPDPPPSWTNPPSPVDTVTQFGTLYIAVTNEADPSRSGSAVDTMNLVAQALGLPQFTGQN
jgi:iron uptake system component EfeO